MFQLFKNMEEIRKDARKSEKGPRTAGWWHSQVVNKLECLSLGAEEEILSCQQSTRNSEQDDSLQNALEIFWSTGMLTQQIPNGFYSVIPEKRLKEQFDRIPTLNELHALELEGYKTETILVDTRKDKKLSMLKQLTVALGKGMNSNPAAMIKKIAELVSDFFKRPNLDSPGKGAADDSSNIVENRGIQLLGHVRHSSCRARAILFKVLSDAVGLESSLMLGLPNDGVVQYVDSYKHMSAIVVLNSVELLVDLMRFPGQLIPRSTKAILMTHISAAGESDSAENDSCDSPLEPNSPMCGYSEKLDTDSSTDKDESLHFQKRFEGLSNLSGISLRNMMLRRSKTTMDRQFSISHSEPDIATRFWRRNRRKVIAEQRTASLSPEYHSVRERERSILSGDRRFHRDYTDDASSSRSDSTSTIEPRRTRRRNLHITPEIGDDIVRAVRKMNETLKQNRIMREHGTDGASSYSPSSISIQDKTNENFHSDTREEASGENSPLYDREQLHLNSPEAISLPSTPHHFRSQLSLISRKNQEMVSTWNKVLESPMFHNKPLLPFQEWNIDFSELTFGTRVGIGFFGEVFRGVWNGTDVAIKVLLELDLTVETMEDFCNEISILSRLRHPNVILFLGACTNPPHLSMITEYMEMGSLYYLIHSSGQKIKLSWRRRLKMLRDICRGLMGIHRMNIVHRDIKSANCLVNKHWTVKICDFGLSRIMTDSPIKDASSAGTPEWMAPELIRNEPFTEKCDIFSLGVIMWEFCTLNRPWEGVPPEKVVYLVANEGSRLDIPEGPLGTLIAGPNSYHLYGLYGKLLAELVEDMLIASWTFVLGMTKLIR